MLIMAKSTGVVMEQVTPLHHPLSHEDGEVFLAVKINNSFSDYDLLHCANFCIINESKVVCSSNNTFGSTYRAQ